MSTVLEMREISKRFAGVVALDDVSLTLEEGEILALLGENGAGKSTLIKILSGAYTQDSGEIFIKGRAVNDREPGTMLEHGVVVIYQELNCLCDLSIAENIFLGNLPINKLGQVDYKKLRSDTEHLLQKVGLKRSPFTDVCQLSVAEMQMMEIAKALSKPTQVLVLDEPTSALNDIEAERLFDLLKNLSAEGKSIIYISHKMDEIFALSDRVQVLRDGKSVGIRITKDTNPTELVTLMVGRSIEEMYPKTNVPKGEVIFEAENLVAAGVNDVSFNVRAGEVVGMFGLMGAGRSEIAKCIFGATRRTAGQMKLKGRSINPTSPQKAIQDGIAYIPRERKSEGIVLTQTVKENITRVTIDSLMRGPFLNGTKERKQAKEMVKKLRIKTHSINTCIECLSGGNQQKVVLGSCLLAKPDLLILNEPTRGIDVGAKVEIYNLIEELCREGIGVLMISSETPEIMGISDRILVICEGRITGEYARDNFDQERIMHCAIGGDTNEQ